MRPTNEQATFYLKFVNAAYTMYGSDPNNLTPAAQGFPDKSYQVLTYLNSIDPVSGTRVFFGFLAADPANTQTKPAILAIRGTDNLFEWFTDADAIPTPFVPFANSYVATGFDEFVNGIGWISNTGDRVVNIAETLAAAYPKGVVIAGHSLGGAMGTLLMAGWLAALPKLMLTLVTAASPAVGDYVFYNNFNSVTSGRSWRYINDFDAVASFLDAFYYQVETGIHLYSYDILPTPICEHSLLTYLYLLSPSGTPCTSSCCILDEEVKSRMRLVFEPRRLARNHAP